MDVIVLIGRILFAGLFIGSGFAHLTQRAAMAGYAGSKRVPAPLPAVLVSGVMILLGGIGVLLGIWADLGALLILAFLVAAALLMHRFWEEKDPGARQLEQIQFMKDTALAGGALILFALVAYAGSDLGLTITGPVFDLN